MHNCCHFLGGHFVIPRLLSTLMGILVDHKRFAAIGLCRLCDVARHLLLVFSLHNFPADLDSFLRLRFELDLPARKVPPTHELLERDHFPSQQAVEASLNHLQGFDESTCLECYMGWCWLAVSGKTRTTSYSCGCGSLLAAGSLEPE